MSTSGERQDQERRKISRRRVTRWQALFPYHQDADELTTRRSLLHLAVMASGALFAATSAIVGLGYFRPLKGRVKRQAIIKAADIPVGKAHYFHYPTADEQAILVHLADGRFVAYSGKCTHLSCSVYYQEQHESLYCPCHEGFFNPETGDPTAGPPQRPLPQIKITQEGGVLYAEEERPE